jgi:Helix-hairpin-helix motif
MVDSCPQIRESEHLCCAEGDVGGPLVKGRFVLLTAVVAGVLGVGFGGGGGEASRHTVVAPVPDLRLDPNTVPPQVLTALPHFGAALVDRWVKAREDRPFESLEDARSRVRGLGPATLEQIKPYFELPDGRHQVVESMVSQEAEASRTELRTAGRKKPGSSKKRAAQPAGLASRPVRPSDL